MRLLALAFAFSVTAAPAAQAGDVAPRGVIELFTSQGCSACPPADRLANELARDGQNLVLTLPVDYWDYLGWRDTLASPANSARQRAYAATRGDRKIYTPQIVVNGREAAVGGDGAAVAGVVTRAEAGDNALTLPVAVAAMDGRVSVVVPASEARAGKRQAEVWAFSVERSRTVQIGRGENAGRTVTYANVVRKMTRLGVWSGDAAKFDVPADELSHPDSDAIAIVVQAGSGGQPGPILGAAQVDQPKIAPTLQSRLRDPL